MRRSGWTPCLVLLIAFSFVGSSGAWASDRHNGARIEGTWFCTTSPAPGFGLVETQMLLTAGRSGTIKTSESDDLTGFNPVFGALGFVVQTSGAGGWKRSRGHAFDLNYLQLGFTGVGENTGLLSSLARFRCAVEVRGDAMAGACDADIWFAVDSDGDGFPSVANPVTTDPDFEIPDIGEMACDRLPVMPKK